MNSFFNEVTQYYILYKSLPFFSLALVSVWNEKFYFNVKSWYDKKINITQLLGNETIKKK